MTFGHDLNTQFSSAGKIRVAMQPNRGGHVLRIHFTSEDLARTRVASAPDPLWELALSTHVLRVRGSAPMHTGWKNEVATHLHPGGPLREQVAMLLAVNPPVGYFPDFLTPADSVGGFEAGLDAVLSTPQPRLHSEIGQLALGQGGMLPSVVGDLVTGARSALHELGDAMTRYHEVAIAPVWDRIRASFDADRALRARTVLDGGTAALLDALHPTVRFVESRLEIFDYPADRDLYLNGRGLLLVPSYFKFWSKPMALVDPELPPVLCYPVDRKVLAAGGNGYAHLVALLGRTRAAVLELVASGTTTGELARRLKVSAAAASQHIGVLRESGLVLSSRDGNTVHHTLTPLGLSMLNGG
jgi:DNA-binding transcriptional ArsR family regulator